MLFFFCLDQNYNLAQQSVGVDDVSVKGFLVNKNGVRVGKDSEFMYTLDPNGCKLEFCRVF